MKKNAIILMSIGAIALLVGGVIYLTQDKSLNKGPSPSPTASPLPTHSPSPSPVPTAPTVITDPGPEDRKAYICKKEEAITDKKIEGTEVVVSYKQVNNYYFEVGDGEVALGKTKFVYQFSNQGQYEQFTKTMEEKRNANPDAASAVVGFEEIKEADKLTVSYKMNSVITGEDKSIKFNDNYLTYLKQQGYNCQMDPDFSGLK